MSRTKLVLIFAAVLAVVFVYGAFKVHGYQSEIRALNHELATKDETIEIKDGLYVKRTLEMRELQSLLDEKDGQLLAMKKELKNGKNSLLSVTRASVYWKEAYEALLKDGDGASETEVVSDDGTKRARVDFQKDFGYIGVSGHTLTSPAEAFVSVRQNRPLKLAVAIAQNKDGTWKTYATSSEDNVGVDIELTGVDPYVLSRRWYERISLGGGVMGWKKPDSVSLGASYSIPIGKKWSLQPSVFVTSGLDPKMWLGVFWNPFVRD